MKNNWHSVFDRLPLERKNESLAEISGFDKFTIDYSRFRNFILEKLFSYSKRLKAKSICEIGCGCGDKLKFFYEKGLRCFGVDYSENMVARAKIEVPKGVLCVSDASSLPFKKTSMDMVISNSVFQYFSSKKYATKVLKEILRVLKPGGGIFIWDVPDISFKAKVLEYRGQHEPGYHHLYYDINFFTKFFKERGAKNIAIEFWNKPEYYHSKYRFNCTALF